MAFRAVYDCEILISEIERGLAVYDCFLKEYCDKGWKGRLWGEVSEGKDGNVGHYEESQQYGIPATARAVFYRNDSFTAHI